jgi:hypothetical protein
MESLHNLRAHARKAGASVAESRDTTHPALVTHMLMSLLEAMGGPADVPALRKRVRDDVNLKNADVPWRRLPFLLILRVGALRQLHRILGGRRGRACYKFLVCTVLAQLLQDCAGRLSAEKTHLLRPKLCRRMAKLEMDGRNETASPEEAWAYEKLFGTTKALVHDAIHQATSQIETAWETFRQHSVPRIPTLPPRAPWEALRLSLPHSGEYLDRLLSSSSSQQQPHQPTPSPPAAIELQQHPCLLGTRVQQVQEFTSRVVHLAAIELRVEREAALDEEATGSRCLALRSVSGAPSLRWAPPQSGTPNKTARSL